MPPKLRGEHYKPKKGLVPRGYDFLGPFNDNIIGPGRNPADEAARWHDMAYTSPSQYFFRSQADEEFIKHTGTSEGWGKFGNRFFRAKKAALGGDLPKTGAHSHICHGLVQAF
jgi:hypothetical protein